MAPHLLTGLGASVLLACGLLLMKRRARTCRRLRAGDFSPHGLRDSAWLASLALQSAGYALDVVALAGAAISLLAVMMQGGIALFVLLAVLKRSPARAGPPPHPFGRRLT